MRTNWVRERLKKCQGTIGCLVGLGSPTVVEMLAHAGFDWLAIESEHNALDSAEIQNMLMAMNGTDEWDGSNPVGPHPIIKPGLYSASSGYGCVGHLGPVGQERGGSSSDC